MSGLEVPAGERRSPITLRDADPAGSAAATRYWAFRDMGPVGDHLVLIGDVVQAPNSAWSWTLYSTAGDNPSGRVLDLAEAAPAMEAAYVALRLRTVRPAGLPIPATALLTAAEREILLRLARSHRRAVDALADALQSNRVTDALQALEISAVIGRQVDGVRPQLGAGR